MAWSPVVFHPVPSPASDLALPPISARLPPNSVDQQPADVASRVVVDHGIASCLGLSAGSRRITRAAHRWTRSRPHRGASGDESRRVVVVVVVVVCTLWRFQASWFTDLDRLLIPPPRFVLESIPHLPGLGQQEGSNSGSASYNYYLHGNRKVTPNQYVNTAFWYGLNLAKVLLGLAAVYAASLWYYYRRYTEVSLYCLLLL